MRYGWAEADGYDQQIAVEAAEIVLAHLDRGGASRKVVDPDQRHRGRHDAIAPRGVVRRIVPSDQPRRPPQERPDLAVVERVPVVRLAARIENQAVGLVIGDELDALRLRLAARAGEDLVFIADLDRHLAVAEARNRRDRAPAATLHLVALYFVEAVIDQHRAVQPLTEKPRQITVGTF